MTKISKFLARCNNVAINTRDEDGHAFSSYASFYYDGEVLYVSVPPIATHVSNIAKNSKASALFVEQPDASKSVQDRYKITLECEVRKIESEDPRFNEIMPKFKGAALGILTGAEDLLLYALTPSSGELVYGFDDTYVIKGEKMNEVNLWKR